jgi:hypothetical protein
MSEEEEFYISDLYVSECPRCTCEFSANTERKAIENSLNDNIIGHDNDLGDARDTWFCDGCLLYIKGFNDIEWFETNYKLLFDMTKQVIGKVDDSPFFIGQCWECRGYIDTLPILLINGIENFDTWALPVMSGFSVCLQCFEESFIVRGDSIYVKKCSVPRDVVGNKVFVV